MQITDGVAFAQELKTNIDAGAKLIAITINAAKTEAHCTFEKP